MTHEFFGTFGSVSGVPNLVDVVEEMRTFGREQVVSEFVQQREANSGWCYVVGVDDPGSCVVYLAVVEAIRSTIVTSESIRWHGNNANRGEVDLDRGAWVLVG